MFLAWLNQIVAAIDKTEGVFQVLSNIAKDYPHALTYPLRISSDQFSFDNSPEGNRKKNELARYFVYSFDDPLFYIFIHWMILSFISLFIRRSFVLYLYSLDDPLFCIFIH